MSYTLTEDQIKSVVPKNIKGNITGQLTQDINNILNDPDIREEYRENVLSYTDVLQNGKWKFKDYIYAVKYVSYKLRGDSNIQAYTKTFPDRVAGYKARGITDYSPWVTSYNKSKLVYEIMSRSMIPTHVLNADIYQKAINVQASLMVTAKSEKVRTDAANSLLNHLKAPETAKIEVDMNVKNDSGIEDLKSATLELVKAQKLALQSGINNAKEIAHSNIIIDVQAD